MKRNLKQSEWDAISGAACIVGVVLLIAGAFVLAGCGSTWQGVLADLHRWTAPPDPLDGFMEGERVPRTPDRGNRPDPMLTTYSPTLTVK